MALSAMSPAKARSYARGALVAFTGLTTFAPGFVPSGIYSVRFALTLIAASGWVVLWAAGALRRANRVDRYLTWAGGAFVIAVLASSALSRFPGAALTHGLIAGDSAPWWIAWTFILVLSARAVLDRACRGGIAVWFVAAVPVAAAGIVQRITGQQVSGPLLNSNYFAPILLVLAPVALGMAYSSENRWVRAAWRAVGALMLVAVVSSGSTAGVLGAVLVVGATLVWAPGLAGVRSATVWRAIGVVLLGGLVAFSLLLAVTVASKTPSPLRAVGGKKILDTSALNRLNYWRVAIREFGDRPVLGVGPDEYVYAGQGHFAPGAFLIEYHPGNAQAAFPGGAHSLPLNVLGSFGLLGALAFLATTAAWAVGARAAWDDGAAGRKLRQALVLGAVGFAFVECVLPFALVLGALAPVAAGLALAAAEPDEAPLTPSSTWIRWMCAALVVVLAFGIGGSDVASWLAFTAAGRSSNRADYIARLEQAASLSPFFPAYRYQIAWSQGQATLDSTAAVVAYHKFVDAEKPDVTGYAPYMVELVRLSLDSAVVSGRRDVSWEAARLSEAARLAPELPDVALERVHLDIAAGDAKAARRDLTKAAFYRDVAPRWNEYAAAVGGLEQATP